jgi:phage-related protein
MTRPIFTWFPDYDSQEDMKPDVEVTKLGDGYEIRNPRGLNFKKQVWSVKFDRESVEAGLIRDFLTARGASEAFTWANPFNETGTFVCDSFKTQRRPGGLVINATFRQVFEY